MRSLFLSVALGIGALGLIGATPSRTEASWLSQALHARYDPYYYGSGYDGGYYPYSYAYPGYSSYSYGYAYPSYRYYSRPYYGYFARPYYGHARSFYWGGNHGHWSGHHGGWHAGHHGGGHHHHR
jgi:hypothetical protein